MFIDDYIPMENALTNLINAIRNNILKFPSIPKNFRTRLQFKDYNKKVEKIEGIISDIAVVEIWQDGNGGVYGLYSCTGIDIIQDEQQKISSEERSSMERILYNIELLRQNNQLGVLLKEGRELEEDEEL